MLLPLTYLWAANTPVWEPGKVVAVEQVSMPAKTPDPTCHSVPKGEDLPEHCQPAYLRAQKFWRVTIEVGNKRLVVRPYRAPKFIDTLNQAGPNYVDPNLTAPSAVEVAIFSNKTVRFRADHGSGIPAIVDSQELLSRAEVASKAELPPAAKPSLPPSIAVAATPAAPAQPVTPASTGASSARVVLLEAGDFHDLEAQEFKAQDIGGGAAVYSFDGDASPAQIASNPPVFLVLADNEAAMGGNPELSRLQVGKGTRQMAYSVAKRHSASSLPITVTEVSATVRKISVAEPLPAGEYVVMLENSSRGFLFEVR